jgi:hypothetical protein
MDRAQSETLGFVFVFAIITMCIGTVYVVGMPGLNDAQDAAREENMVRAFDVLDNNVEDLRQESVPSRATELKLTGGNLGVGQEVRITVNVTSSVDPSRTDEYAISTQPLVYREGDSAIVYESGALLRSNSDGAFMYSDPAWLVDDDRMVVPYVVTYAGSGRSGIGGSSTVLVVAEGGEPAVQGRFESGPSEELDVRVTVESPRAGAWQRYLESNGFTGCTPSAGSVTCTRTTNAVYASYQTIELSFQQ